VCFVTLTTNASVDLTMHPIEQLRFVARASGADASLLVGEAASALSVFRNDRAALLTASRRLLTRQPRIGPLWWMCSHLIASSNVSKEGRRIVEMLQSDKMPRRGDIRALVVDIEGQGSSVVRQLEHHDIEAEDVDASHCAGVVEDADVIIIEAAAVGEAAALVDVGNVTLAATAKALGTPVWLVSARGRALPEPYWQEIVERCADPSLPPWLADHEICSLGLVDRVATSAGVSKVADFVPDEMPLMVELLTRLD